MGNAVDLPTAVATAPQHGVLGLCLRTFNRLEGKENCGNTCAILNREFCGSWKACQLGRITYKHGHWWFGRFFKRGRSTTNQIQPGHVSKGHLGRAHVNHKDLKQNNAFHNQYVAPENRAHQKVPIGMTIA